jgi:hypothetical protein
LLRWQTLHNDLACPGKVIHIGSSYYPASKDFAPAATMNNFGIGISLGFNGDFRAWEHLLRIHE